MKIYNVNPEKSKIKWSSRIGDLEINGELAAHGGELIAELDEVIEGQLSVDLDTLKIVNSSLSKEDEDSLRKHLKSSKLFDDDTIAHYKIEQIIPNENDYTFKGLLQFNGSAFGMDIQADLKKDEHTLNARGKMQASKSNFVFLEELEKVFAEQIKGDKSIKTFEVDCDITANADA